MDYNNLERVVAVLREAARRANWDAQHGPRHLRTGRFFISAVETQQQDSPSSKTAKDPNDLEGATEAARRANWDAQHGPRHLRAGRFFISAVEAGHAFAGSDNASSESPKLADSTATALAAELGR